MGLEVLKTTPSHEYLFNRFFFHRRYQTLILAADNQKTTVEGANLLRQAEEYYKKQLPKIRKLDGAFKVLHNDLESMQSLLSTYCSREQQSKESLS